MNDICPICGENFDTGLERICLDSCGHYLCSGCARNFICSKQDLICPLDRIPINKFIIVADDIRQNCFLSRESSHDENDYGIDPDEEYDDEEYDDENNDHIEFSLDDFIDYKVEVNRFMNDIIQRLVANERGPFVNDNNLFERNQKFSEIERYIYNTYTQQIKNVVDEGNINGHWEYNFIAFKCMIHNIQ